MSWSYSFNPDNSAKDQVRFFIGDTNESDKLLHDEEILYLLKLYNNFPLNASLRACEMIIAKFSRMADQSVGSVSMSYSQKSKAYRDLMNDLRLRIGIEGARPYAGGISTFDKQTNNQNSDLSEPIFTKHQFENKQVAPWTSESQLGEFLNNKI